jgi:hypothetical protein
VRKQQTAPPPTIDTSTQSQHTRAQHTTPFSARVERSKARGESGPASLAIDVFSGTADLFEQMAPDKFHRTRDPRGKETSDPQEDRVKLHEEGAEQLWGQPEVDQLVKIRARLGRSTAPVQIQGPTLLARARRFQELSFACSRKRKSERKGPQGRAEETRRS